MNHHQSNPFLAGWEVNEEPATGVFNNDVPSQVNDPTIGSNETTRRYSSSQADVGGNPFGAQRSTDRRLYHRNMSSFEAASLQLEHAQQMQENGDPSSEQTDLIAKMTADFQSAIETNDKQFSIGADDQGQLDFNPFDPFETIVDDDVSIPSPALTAPANQIQQVDKFSIGNNDEGEANNDVPSSANLGDKSSSMRAHDSIDDDEDELVSTPVRNIKSSSPNKVENSESSHDSKPHERLTAEEIVLADEISNSITKELTEGLTGSENTNSIEKASLFASLLAEAESSSSGSGGGGGQQTGTKANEDTSGLAERVECDTITGEDQDDSRMTHKVENATHVIKGSHSTGDGNVERPVGFFDPFETVIDKDALTSLMNDAQTPPNQVLIQSGEELDELDLGYAPIRAPEPTPIHRPHRDDNNDEHNKSCYSKHDDRSSRADVSNVESTSIETVIENASNYSHYEPQVSSFAVGVDVNDSTSSGAQTNNNSNPEKLYSSSEYSAVPRPKKTLAKLDQEEPALPPQEPAQPKATPARSKANKQRKKASFQEDSSDSSEEDDRIQIVIKARDANQIDGQTGPTIVPLLPPPPSKSSMKQARERGQVDDMPSPVMSYKTRHQEPRAPERSSAQTAESTSKVDSSTEDLGSACRATTGKTGEQQDKDLNAGSATGLNIDNNVVDNNNFDDDSESIVDQASQFVIPMTHSDDDDTYGKPDTPLYDEDTSYVLEEYPVKYEGSGWEMMLRYPPKKKLTSNRFWKKIFVKLAQVPLVPDTKTKQQQEPNEPQTCIALQIYDKPEDKKPMQEIPIQATYTVSEISSQQYDQFGKIFTIKLQYIFYKERVGVRQGQLARFIHSGHIGASTTSGGHGVDPISIGAIKRMGAPIEHSPQISQIIKLGCTSYTDIKQFKNCLEDYLFKMPIHRDRALSTYKTEEVQMAVRDETYLELNQVGQITKQLARVRLFFLSFLNGMPTVEVGINDFHRQGREVVGRMDILPVVTEEWIRLEGWELHSTVDKEEFENPDVRIIKLVPPDATFFELMRFRIRPPRNRELPLQISASMTVTRTKVTIYCEVMVPGCVSRKHGQIPCEGIAIRVLIPECWIYFFREEKHFRMGSKKSVNRRPGKVKGIERFLGGGGLQDINDESSLIEVTSGQAKYEHHHHAIVWRAARWPKESQSAYVQNTMKIRLPLTAYDKMPDSFYEYVHVEYTMPATTVSHTTLRSISVNPCDEEPPEKYVKYAAKYEYKVKMRLSVNLGSKTGETQPEASPIVIMKQPDLHGDLRREEDSSDDDGSDDAETTDQGQGSSRP